MSLLDSYTEKFIIMEKTRTPDAEGGMTVVWTEGAALQLALRFDTSMQARIAEKQGVTSTYTFLAPKDCGLEYHDVLKRASDGLIFRITSIAGENVTPGTSSLNLTAVTAERWVLPT